MADILHTTEYGRVGVTTNFGARIKVDDDVLQRHGWLGRDRSNNQRKARYVASYGERTTTLTRYYMGEATKNPPGVCVVSPQPYENYCIMNISVINGAKFNLLGEQRVKLLFANDDESFTFVWPTGMTIRSASRATFDRLMQNRSDERARRRLALDVKVDEDRVARIVQLHTALVKQGVPDAKALAAAMNVVDSK